MRSGGNVQPHAPARPEIRRGGGTARASAIEIAELPTATAVRASLPVPHAAVRLRPPFITVRRDIGSPPFPLLPPHFQSLPLPDKKWLLLPRAAAVDGVRAGQVQSIVGRSRRPETLEAT